MGHDKDKALVFLRRYAQDGSFALSRCAVARSTPLASRAGR